MSSKLAPSAKEMLAPVLLAYETAKLGDLNRTAEDLRDACFKLGWRQAIDGPMRKWAQDQLRPEGS